MNVEHAQPANASAAEHRVHTALVRAGKLTPRGRVLMVTDPRGLFGVTPGDLFVTMLTRADDAGSVATWIVTALSQVIDPRTVSPEDLWSVANG
ncbi:MAG TPA: hypothetical protein VLC93_13305 [Myxococcota bacterium]|nr:hypothetical protein [Myxococcota bacterium]